MNRICRSVRKAVVAFVALAAFGLASGAPAGAATLIEQGDTVRVAVAEAPKIGGDRKVDPDGRIMLPEIGSLQVAGKGLDDVRQMVERALIERDILKSPTVVVEITRYRPFYIGGKVARPGAIDYEPGLTVRHALILAGGIGSAAEERSGTLDVPQLRARWETASYQLMQINSALARLEAELERSQAIGSDSGSGGTSSSDASALLSLDQKILTDRLASWSENQVHLRQQLALFDLEIDVLGQQAGLQEQERDLVREQVKAARNLVEKGLMPLPRFQELQNVESQASRDLLENKAFSARARQGRADVEHDINSADTIWRTDIRRQIRDAMIERARAKSELDALSTQIINAGADMSGTDAEHFKTVIVIYRSVGGRDETITAEMNTDIRPGDIIDVSFARGAG